MTKAAKNAGAAPAASRVLGSLAVRLGYLSQEKLLRALEIQREDRAIGYDRPLGEILVAANYMSEEQVSFLLKLQAEGVVPEKMRPASPTPQPGVIPKASKTPPPPARKAASERPTTRLRKTPSPQTAHDTLPPVRSPFAKKPALPTAKARPREHGTTPTTGQRPAATGSGRASETLPPGLPGPLSSHPKPRPKVAPHAVPQALPQIAGYEIHSRLGQGGIGVVYRGTHNALQMDVAIKVLRPEFTRQTEFVRRFFREARAAARLRDHPGIVRAVDAGQVGHLCYFVMEYVKGLTLQELITEHAPLNPRAVVIIGHQVADALDHAWSKGMVHRDLKPENLIIQPESGLNVSAAVAHARFTVKVMDLGLAKAVIEDGAGIEPDSNITQFHGPIGTPRYMSPEQAQGHDVDTRADIYSLGATLYEAATGKPPYHAPSAFAVMVKHIRAPVPDPRALVPDMPMSLAQMLRTCMAKKPDARYPTPTALRQVLTKIYAELDKQRQNQAPKAPDQGPGSTQTSAPVSPGAESPQGLRQLGRRLRRRRGTL